MQLTIEQQKIINSKANKILVKAGAGTGKTEVLTRRIINLIESDENLSIKDMAIITFTNKATEELLSRLKREFYRKWKELSDPHEKLRFRYELESLNSSQISTIHMFCKSILESIGPFHNDYMSYSPVFRVQSDLLSLTIDETLEDWLLKKQNEGNAIEHLKYMPVHELKEVLQTLYSAIRTKGLDFNSIVKATEWDAYVNEGPMQRKLKKELVELIKEIRKFHVKNKFDRIDVDDLLEYTANILKANPSYADMIRRKYKYIFVDEFQDTSLYQSDILKILCNDTKHSPKLFVVGDIKQSIYEFRGADTESYNRMERWIAQEGEVFTLSINWRSTPEVIAYVNHVFDKIKKNPNYSFKNEPLRPSESKENIELTQAYEWLLANKDTNCADLIAEYISYHIKSGKEEAQNFTILVRKNYEIEIIKNTLENHGIEVEVIGSGYFFNQKEIIDTFKVLKAILSSRNSSAFLESLNTIIFQNDVNLFSRILNRIQSEDLIYKYTPSQLIDFIFQATGVLKKSPTRVKSNLNKLKEISRSIVKDEKLSLSQYVNWLEIMISSKAEEPLADTVSEENKKVKLMTIHRAKGLEFPIVILPNLDQSFSESSLKPDILIDKETNCIEFCYQKYYENGTFIMSSGYEEAIKRIQYNVYSEELRVLYVALTRAKRKLVLCGKKDLDKDKICYQNWLMED